MYLYHSEIMKSKAKSIRSVLWIYKIRLDLYETNSE